MATDAEKAVAELFQVDVQSPVFRIARTHSSYTHENPKAPSNERLEFLGDSVLSYFVSVDLFQREGERDEGWLTQTRAKLVSTKALAAYARKHNLGEVLISGRGTRDTLDSDNVLADLVEALLAATYREAGEDAAREVVAAMIEFGLARGQSIRDFDPKSFFQEVVQSTGKKFPRYEVVEATGAAHEMHYRVGVRVGGKMLAVGDGASKRMAERSAAEVALELPEWRDLAEQWHLKQQKKKESK